MGKKNVIKEIGLFALTVVFFANIFLLVPQGIAIAVEVANAAQLQKIVVAVPARTVAFVPLFLGKKLGYYEDEGLHLEIVRMKSDMVSAGLISGEVQFGVTLSNFVRAAAAGTPVRLLMTMERKMEYHEFMTAKEITSATQLKGQTIGITARYGNLHLIAMAVLKAHGISENDITFVSYPGARPLQQALDAGSVKGATMPPPLSIYMSQKGFRVLGSGPDYYNGGILGLVTSEKFLEKNRKSVIAVIRATLKGIQYLREHPTEGTAFIAKNQRVSDPEVAKKLYDMMADIGSRDGEITEQWVLERLEEMRHFGGKPKVTDPKKILDLGPLREARKALKK